MGTSNLASLIYRDGILSQRMISMIEKDCGHHTAAFAKMLVAMGLFSEESLVAYIAKRTALPIVHGSLITPAMAALDAVNVPIMEELEVIPISIEGRRIKVAMADPLDQSVLLQLRFFSELRVSPVVAMFSTLERSFYKFHPGFKMSRLPLEKVLALKLADTHRRTRPPSKKPSRKTSADSESPDPDSEYLTNLLKGDDDTDSVENISPNAELAAKDRLAQEIPPDMSPDMLLQTKPTATLSPEEKVSANIPPPPPPEIPKTPAENPPAPVTPETDQANEPLAEEAAVPEPGSVSSLDIPEEVEASDAFAPIDASVTNELAKEPLIPPPPPEAQTEVTPLEASPLSPPQKNEGIPSSFSIDPAIGFLNHAIAMTSLALTAIEALPIVEHALSHADFAKGGIYRFTDQPSALLFQWGEDKTMKPLPYTLPEDLTELIAKNAPTRQWQPLATDKPEWSIFQSEQGKLFSCFIPSPTFNFIVLSSANSEKLASKAVHDLSIKLIAEFLKK